MLLFRLFYYITPFALALIILGVREILASVMAPDVPHVGEIAHDVLNEDEKKEALAYARTQLKNLVKDPVVFPISAETAFIEARRQTPESPIHGIVAMYHDQALVPLKALGFGRCVNWTLGLPMVRTSVDHGTADSLVGTGKASPDSLIAALELADRLTR